jgi:hypothetical protein
MQPVDRQPTGGATQIRRAFAIWFVPHSGVFAAHRDDATRSRAAFGCGRLG